MTSPADVIRVALVDDQVLVRSGFKMLIDSQPDLTVIAEAASGREALQSPAIHSADVILMDVRMPEMDGIEATQKLLAMPALHGRPSPPRIVVLTTFDQDEYAFAAIQAGASGFLLKDVQPEDLLSGIRSVHTGNAVIAPSTTRRLLEHVSPLLARNNPACDETLQLIESLTPREYDVFVKVAEGKSNPEIAEELFLSMATVKTHVGRILSKLNARDRVHVVVLAYQAGVVSP
ncbi:DNA-binding NarL/FixJ family response regulator [Neomicrococcus aestuarii]|uniref:DNA-binding NarL/FixJ family response regulator n=1 Tax=Neomicrococcus aestuarii TaxID=556325 RepID=A0A7W8WYM3_9MICC|nr:response regulator transcription factor [Neomicrococcus aestuarii]MBB5511342.1 DNA-binding NarL/FixJ family response regulator [Neomicrococcus aestuarii]